MLKYNIILLLLEDDTIINLLLMQNKSVFFNVLYCIKHRHEIKAIGLTPASAAGHC